MFRVGDVRYIMDMSILNISRSCFVGECVCVSAVILRKKLFINCSILGLFSDL